MTQLHPHPHHDHHDQQHQQLQACSYGSWQPRYASLAHDSVVLPLAADVVAFLLEDGLVLPDASDAMPRRSRPTEVVVEGVDYDPDDLYSDSSSSSSSSSSKGDGDAGGEDSSRQQPWPQRFPALHAALSAAIQQLGGLVAPRLNWSSPTDALWLSSDNSLRCRNADEVLLLLKSSDRAAHDLEQLQQQWQACSSSTTQQQQLGTTNSSSSSSSGTLLPAQLVLRRWASLLPEREFRCFIHNHALVAASQRDPSQHFPQLSQPGAGASLADIRARLARFHSSCIGDTFALSSYAMDVYVPPEGPVRLLDFNPILPTTLPLLFSWQELPFQHMWEEADQAQQGEHQHQQQQQDEGTCSSSSRSSSSSSSTSDDVELRVVRHQGMILPGTRAATGMPLDMLGLQDGGLERVMQQLQQQQLSQARR